MVFQAITGAQTPACLFAASNSVETVTPPFVGSILHFAELSYRSLQFTPNHHPPGQSLSAYPSAGAVGYRGDGLQIDRLIFLAFDSIANLLWRHLSLGQQIGVMFFLGAGRTLRAMGPFKAAMQTLMSEGSIAAAITGQLVKNRLNGCRFFVDLHLP